MSGGPLQVVTADESELLTTSIQGCITHRGSKPYEHFYSTDREKQEGMGEKGSKTPIINVPQFCLEGKDIIIFSDLCQVVLKTWGSYNNLCNLLKKQGIKTCQFDQTQLRILKNIGVLEMQVKNCSFISNEDFTQILHKYDEDYNTDHVKHIQLSTPIMISNINSTTKCQGNQDEKNHCQVLPADANAPSQSIASSTNNIHTFAIGNQDFVMLSELYSLFESHFKRTDLLNQVLQNLKLVVGTLTANELARMEIYRGVTCNNSLRSLYIPSKDFERVLQYTSALLDTNPPDITWDHLGTLSRVGARKGNNKEDNFTAGSMSTSSSTAAVHAIAVIPENNIDTVTNMAQAGHVSLGSEDSNVVPNALPILPETCKSLASETASSTNTCNSTMNCVVRTCLVKGEVVVCIPDLRKVVIDLYGQSVQVGSYMHRLKIPTHRFSSGCLKRLKAHNILSSKATLCTYITKTDAERLLKMYHMCNHSDNQSDSLPRIEWGEPIILENAVNKASEDRVESPQLKQSAQAILKIPLFIINYHVVVALQDVHRAVQLLNGQSVQLRYNLDKLGIVKHKYSYSDVHQLKVLGHINRPSSCTYITKADVDMLLQFYTTPENEDRLKLIEWQQPIAVERLENISDSISNPEIESIVTENEDENNSDTGPIVEEYSISDLYKVFVGDDLESNQSSSSSADDDNQHENISQVTLSHLSSSTPPLLSFSTPAQRNLATPDSRDEVNSDSDQRQASTMVNVSSDRLSSAGMISMAQLVVEPSTVASNHSSAAQQPCDRSIQTVDHEGADVNQMQGDTCSPVTSTLSTRNRPTATREMGVAVPSQTYTGSQTMHHSPSSCVIVPNSNSGIKESVPSISTGSILYSTCGVTACRAGQMPSACSTFTSHGHYHHSCKRLNEHSASDAAWPEQQAKKYRANDEDILRTLQRKETEMKILHDAYQEQIKQERQHRLAVQRELDQFKDSNTELLKNIERKELEMQILHDSYKLQMDLERKKREELEIEVLQLRDKVGACENVPRVKQEPS